MAPAEAREAGSSHRRSSSREGRRRSQRHSATRDKSSSADKASEGSWNVDRGRSRTRRASNPVSDDSLRRRGYHSLFSSFGKVFHVEKRWKMIRDMGSGAYGVVISAADEISGETVAIKLVTRVFDKVSLAKRALREITLLRHFANHENITGLIDVDAISKDFDEIYLFMEPMEADLHQIIKSGQTLTNEHVQYFIYQVLRGMKYIHSASVVHRDLKPGNLLVNADCELKICDFGLSRGFDSTPDENATHMTEYVATRWYRAPEIMLAFRRYNTAIDVWSIGCILAELILGKPLFKGKDYVDQLNKILDVLGTPDESVVKRIGSDKAQAYVRSLSYRKTVPFRKLMPSADPQALDLLERMLTFDPQQRITVPEALEHPWLASYHDVNDEPDCPVPYEKWRFIEKLETIEEYREALWNEIEEYRHEVRSINFDLSTQLWSVANTNVSSSPSAVRRDSVLGTVDAPKLAPEVLVEEDGREVTAVELDAESKDKLALDAAPSTVTASTLVSSPEPASLRPDLERQDSIRPPTPVNDPVVSYARRSSIMQLHQHQQQQQAATSVSPARNSIASVSGLPVYAEEGADATTAYPSASASHLREGNVVPARVPSPAAAMTSSSVSGAGSIPFPSTTGGSYIVPGRSRTTSTFGDYGSGLGQRKLLRTLSTVSIHESAEGAGGLAAMGAIGQAIIAGRETAADAPASEMPRDFDTVQEEEERSGTATGSGSSSAGHGVQPGRAAREGSASRRVSQVAEAGAAPGAEGSGQKKKEKRFILF